jgi:hypothetical protein
MYKLRGWINEDKINWEIVLRQKKAFQMSKKYIDKMLEARQNIVESVFRNKNENSVKLPVAFQNIIANIQGQLTLNSNSTIRRFIDNVLRQNDIETKQLKIIMQLNSIEGIKTAVSLGLGAAFVSSSAIEKEIKLETIDIIKIENIKITRTLSILSNSECYKSKAFDFFYHELRRLKDTAKN